MRALKDWLALAPAPPALPEGKRWHVFLSYRSVHRHWVLQLHDILKSLGFEVFLDQFVLKSNDDLVLALSEGLDASLSGILIWSSRTEDSAWCRREFATMAGKELAGDYRFSIVTLDAVDVPGLASPKLRVEFSMDSEGPQGTGLLRLLYGIVDQPLPPEAIRFGTAVDEEARDAKNKIEAARAVGKTGKNKLVELSQTQSVAWLSTPVLRCFATECLIKRGDYSEALSVLNSVLQDFPRSIRAKQLKGLALARMEQTEDAQMILGELHAAGNLDPETMGIYARTWMDRYNVSGNKLYLAKSRSLYLKAFEIVPSDSYVGINAAAKSVLLGEMDLAVDLASRVEKLVGMDAHPTDYWKTATAAEAQLIKGNYPLAAKLYGEAVLIAPDDHGSHRSTAGQAKLLMDRLGTSRDDQQLIEAALAHLDTSSSDIHYGPTSDLGNASGVRGKKRGEVRCCR
jgi:tetratricopeptide (TPR) repeat protein